MAKKESSSANLKEAFTPTISVEDIAKICHAANKQYCESIGDYTQVPWDALGEADKYAILHGVKFLLHYMHRGQIAPQYALHAEWCKIKVKQGWSFGPVKDSEHKQHPALIPYAELPPFQQAKDSLFQSIVLALYSSGVPIEIEKIAKPNENAAHGGIIRRAN